MKPVELTRLKGMAEIDIADSNLLKLERIREVIRIEEGTESNMDGTLGRILDFYRKFVPYSPGLG